MADPAVPFLDVGATYRTLAEEMDNAFHRVMNSGWYLLGAELDAFESEFAEACGARHAIGLASGLDALVLTLRALEIGAGDEVIVPSNTFIATWLAVSAVGARIVPVEPDPRSFVIAPDAVEEAVTEATRAVLPVHLYGLPADMSGLARVVDGSNIALVADAAQAHAAAINGKPVGGSGLAACWSFYPGKNLGAFGDGGAVTTDDDTVAARLRSMRNYGSSAKYVHAEQGVNSRLDELQAAFLRIKLVRLEAWTERRREIARRYAEALDPSVVTAPVEPPGSTSAWHLYVVLCERRDALQQHLAAHGVQTLIHYPVPPHRQAAYAEEASREHWRLPIADDLASRCLSLPIGPHLTAEQQERVIELVNRFAA